MLESVLAAADKDTAGIEVLMLESVLAAADKDAAGIEVCSGWLVSDRVESGDDAGSLLPEAIISVTDEGMSDVAVPPGEGVSEEGNCDD